MMIIIIIIIDIKKYFVQFTITIYFYLTFVIFYY